MSHSTLLQVDDLVKSFGGLRATDHANLSVRTGEIHALIGPNGAGKTTVFNLLTKFLTPTRGKILFGGRDITQETPAHVARRGMVRSFQISAVFPNLTVLENVRVALQRTRSDVYAFWRSDRHLRILNERAFSLLEDVGLSDFAAHRAADLSYGRKRALEIATTLALDPELLLLDEPTAGMGHEDIDRIAALIGRIAKTRTVLMVEHNLSVVSSLSNKITVLARGKVLAEGNYATLSKDPRVIEAYIGSAHA